MPAAAEAPAKRSQVHQLGTSESEAERMQKVRLKIASGLFPLIGVGAAISVTASMSMDMARGVAMLTAEIALGLLSIYILWPKHNPKER